MNATGWRWDNYILGKRMAVGGLVHASVGKLSGMGPFVFVARTPRE